MGQKGENQRDISIVDYLIVIFRLPIGLLGMLIVVAFFAVCFTLESVVAIVAFPIAALVATRKWIQQSWLGEFPISIHEFTRDRFKHIRGIWGWVMDPTQGLNDDIELAREWQGQPVAQKPAVDSEAGCLGGCLNDFGNFIVLAVLLCFIIWLALCVSDRFASRI